MIALHALTKICDIYDNARNILKIGVIYVRLIVLQDEPRLLKWLNLFTESVVRGFGASVISVPAIATENVQSKSVSYLDVQKV